MTNTDFYDKIEEIDLFIKASRIEMQCKQGFLHRRDSIRFLEILSSLGELSVAANVILYLINLINS